MTAQALIVWLLIGTLAGYLAGVFANNYSFGTAGNAAIGISGSFVAGFLLPRFEVLTIADVGSQIVAATIGAVLMLFFVGLLRRTI